MALYSKTYTFVNGTTADGGQVDTEITALGSSVNSITDAQIDSAANIAISKTTLGTFTNWTAFGVTVTGLTLGNGTLAARYTQIGKVVDYNVTLTFGSTTSQSGAFGFDLPVASVSTAYVGSAFANDSGTRYVSSVFFGSGTTLNIATHGGSSSWGATLPFTWGSGDVLRFSIAYEVA